MSFILWGSLIGVTIGILEYGLRHISLKIFNTLTLGLFLGLLMGAVMTRFLSLILPDHGQFIEILLYCLGAYLGVRLTFRFSHQFTLSIPFIRLMDDKIKVKQFLIDASLLSDERLVDLAVSGLFDHRLVVPKCVECQLQQEAQSLDESIKARGNKGLEILKRLKEIEDLGLIFDEKSKDILTLAQELPANILTADFEHRVSSHVKWINMNTLAQALKPRPVVSGPLKIKVQRLGKETGQGVGYLEDGTMVVINGGAVHMGQTVVARILSIKHTPAGRLLFCNLEEEEILTS